MSTKAQLEKYLGIGRIKENFNLSPYLTLRTQTLAEYYFEAESLDDLINARKTSLMVLKATMVVSSEEPPMPQPAKILVNIPPPVVAPKINAE
mgnify:CR=1 FL=1